MPDTDIHSLMNELGSGSIKPKLQHILSETALSAAMHGGGKKVGKVTIEMTIHKIKDNENQVIVSTELKQIRLTSRGKTTMSDTTDTPFFLGKGGVLTINQPKEDNNNQYGLLSSIDGKS